MSYRPITDVWILARPKVAYYGAYPNGFLERARVFLPVTRTEPVLHVCGGSAKKYPTWATLCPNDVTCDLDASLKPDAVWNVKTHGVPQPADVVSNLDVIGGNSFWRWRGIIADPPYTRDDAAHYAPGAAEFPEPAKLLADCLDVVQVGGRVGMLHYVFPRPKSVGVKLIAHVAVIVGYGNRERCYSVFEKL